MARQLWLLRHADAEPHGTRPDSERRLTERGEGQARLAGLALARMGMEFEALLSSPKERALSTATVVAAALGDEQRARLGVHAPLAGGFDARQALAALEDAIPPIRDGRALLVGHEPDLSSVVGQLTGAHIDLKKGGLAVVRLMDGPPARAVGRRSASRAPLLRSEVSPTHPGGELLALLRPGELALIAGRTGSRGNATIT
jgi:phosphohistidine phosphatase